LLLTKVSRSARDWHRNPAWMPRKSDKPRATSQARQAKRDKPSSTSQARQTKAKKHKKQT